METVNLKKETIIKLEIAKKNHNELIIYGTLILTMIIFITVMVNVSMSENFMITFAVLTILIGITIFKIIPNLAISKHSKNGEIILNENSIEVRNTFDRNKIEISKLKKLKIKILGYDGQSRIGSSYSSVGSDNRPVDGLENKLSYYYENKKYEYEFYIGTPQQSETTKNIINRWKSINNEIETIVLR